MDSATRIFISTLATVILVPWLLNKLSASNEKAIIDGEFVVMKYSRGFKILLYVCAVLFSGIAFLAWRFPGKTDPAALPVVILLFVGFALLSIVSIWLMDRSLTRWSDQAVYGADLIGRKHNFLWADLAGAQYVEWAQMFRLTDKSGKSIWVSPYMQGFEDFFKKMNLELEHRGLPSINMNQNAEY
ncbi:MAG: hypothetical protein K2W82_16920 [Candidatus Obscuribacterales bacterium]|nr:hypothetical protein [Candidatus Obscuribacterales bacterium]